MGDYVRCLVKTRTVFPRSNIGTSSEFYKQDFDGGGKTDKLNGLLSVDMESVFLVQPWVQTRNAMDACRLCYQERETKDHLECKRAQLVASNSLLAVLKLEKGHEFEEALKTLEEAKSKCLSKFKPDNECHNQTQNALNQAFATYDKVLEDYRKKLPNRTPPRL